MTGSPVVRIPRRKSSQLRGWRQAQYDNAPSPAARLRAAWDNLLRPAIKAQAPATAGDLVRQATTALVNCAEAMASHLPLNEGEARRREGQRRKFRQARTAWARMAAAYDSVLSAAKALSTGRHITTGERARRAAERDRLLTECAAELARIASVAEGR
jgi:hypothetical protein